MRIQLKNNNTGFGSLGLVAIIIAIVAISAIGAVVWHKDHHSSIKQSTSTSSKIEKKSQDTQAVTSAQDPYAGWKTYSNTLYAFSFRYPASWTVDDSCNGQTNSNSEAAFHVDCGLDINFDTNEKYKAAAELEISSDDIAKVSAFYDTSYGQVNSSSAKLTKTTDNLKGKVSVQYVFDDSGSTSKRYLFSVNNKTYIFNSINEELNDQRSTTYQSDFDKVFSSLVI